MEPESPRAKRRSLGKTAISWSLNRMLAGSLFETKRTGDPANPWRNDNAPPTLLFPAVLAGEHPRLTTDGFLTLRRLRQGSARRQTARPDTLYRGAKTAKA